MESKKERKMKDGEKALGVLIALMGAAMGQSVTAQYGVNGDASPKRILKDEEVRRILELDEDKGNE